MYFTNVAESKLGIELSIAINSADFISFDVID